MQLQETKATHTVTVEANKKYQCSDCTRTTESAEVERRGRERSRNCVYGRCGAQSGGLVIDQMNGYYPTA